MFRNIFLFSCSLMFLMSCTTDNKNTMTLKGHINGLKKGTVLLERYIDTSYIAIDSAVIYGDSSFELKQQLESPEVLHLYVRLDNGDLLDDRLSFFAEPGEVSLYTKLDDFSDATVVGSENHDLLLTYYNMTRRYSDRNLNLIVEEFNAKKSGNDSLSAAIENKKMRLIQSSYLATVNFALQNTTHEIAPFVMVYETPDVNVRYLDTVYNSLSEPIKASKYGKELEARITSIKQER